MIKYSDLESTFAQNNLNITEYNVETNYDVELPIIVYIATGAETFEADGINFFNIMDVTLALVDQTLNFPMQRAIEGVLDEISTGYDKNIQFDDDERLYSVSYSFTVIDG